MIVTTLPVMIAQAAAKPEGTPLWTMLPPMILMAVMAYFILIVPQKRAKAHDALLKSLKRGDKILTTGGIVAEVISVKDKSVSIRSADAKFEILKSAVAEITERTTAESAQA